MGHHRFGVRKQATAELARLGPLAEPALRRALAESQSEEVRARAQQLLAALDEPHQRSGQALRQLRAVHVLERIGSQEAKAVLRKLAGGSPSATATQRAAAALDRLGLAGK
jgi:HEAT repeat protein